MNLPKQKPIDPVAGSPVESPFSDEDEEVKPLEPLRKFSTTVQPGSTVYVIRHNLETVDVLVQTRIAGRIREGGISIRDLNTVQLTFGGVLNEPMDVVVIG
jgi:hypothetical protein